MNPSHKVQIDVYLRCAIESKSIWMRHMCYLPFVPRTGDTIRFAEDADEDNTGDVVLEEVVWDTSNRMFVCQYIDESVAEAFSSGDELTIADAIAHYKSLGFTQITVPTIYVS